MKTKYATPEMEIKVLLINNIINGDDNEEILDPDIWGSGVAGYNNEE